MRILIFDTETSGLDPQWNVILQLSYQIVDSDSWATIKTVNHFFSWPEDKTRVTMEAINVNGLTEEVLTSKQLSNRKSALEEFVTDKDSCNLLVAHNIEFDKKFILSSCREEGVKFASSGWSQSYDTMKRTTSYCQIPKVWGNGYKWPKLTELADCLGIDYSRISLHDSSGDVELTKLCFKQILAEGLYTLPKETDLTMSLHVETPDDLHFEVRKNGELINELFLTGIYGVSKKELNAARQELIKKWSEENDEERNDLIQIYRKSPKLKSRKDFQAEIEAIKPNQYVRRVFNEQAPSRDEIESELEEEAELEVSSWMFWSINRKRREYVEERLESRYQEKIEAYNKRLAQHEESENKAQEEFNLQSQKQSEERKKRLTSILEGKNEYLEKELLRIPDVMSLEFPYHVEAKLEGTAISIKLLLPQPNDLPHLEGVRLASGNYKIKEIPDKKKKKDYAEWVLSIAIYVVSCYLNVSPMVDKVTVRGFVSVCGEDTDEICLYEASFDRATFNSLKFDELELESVVSKFIVYNNLTKDVLGRLFEVKEIESKQEVKGDEQKQESKGVLEYVDSLFDDAARLIVQEQNGSVALLQRKFQIGYNRAGSIMEQLEKAGIVGIAQGSNPREVLISNEQKLEEVLNDI